MESVKSFFRENEKFLQKFDYQFFVLLPCINIFQQSFTQSLEVNNYGTQYFGKSNSTKLFFRNTKFSQKKNVLRWIFSQKIGNRASLG